MSLTLAPKAGALLSVPAERTMEAVSDKLRLKPLVVNVPFVKLSTLLTVRSEANVRSPVVLSIVKLRIMDEPGVIRKVPADPVPEKLNEALL